MKIIEQALNLCEEFNIDLATVENMIRKHGYNKTLLILIEQ